MKLLKKIRKIIAKIFLKIFVKIIGGLSWEELDSLFPKPDYKNCFDLKPVDWSNVKLKYPCNPITQEQNDEE